MTMTAAICAAALRSSNPRSNSALSIEGRELHERVTEVWGAFDKSISLRGPHGELFSELDSLVAEHSTPGWDGDSAPPVSFATLQNAKDFIGALSHSTAKPELAVEPDDAAISFEWHVGYRKVVSVSVGESDRLAVAGLDGVDHWHAVLKFDGANLPPLVAESIQRIAP